MKKSVFFVSVSVIIFCVTPAFPNTNISFGNNISGEFPDMATYNRFVSTLSDAFNDGMKYQTGLIYNSQIAISQAQIVDQVEKFSIYIFGGMDFGRSEVNYERTVESIKHVGIDTIYHITGAFGFRLREDLSLYISISAMQYLIPVGLNLLWKIFEKTSGDNENRSNVENREMGQIAENTNKMVHRLFFSPGLVFSFFENRHFEGKTITSDDSKNPFPYVSDITEGNSFDNGNGAVRIAYPVEVIKFRRNIFSLDLSLKYHLKFTIWGIKTNLYAGLGATLHINHLQQHFRVLSTNVKYSGGTPGGIDTTMEVNSDIRWVNITPHFSIGFQFEAYKWLILRIPFISIVYLPTAKKFIFNLNFGLGIAL